MLLAYDTETTGRAFYRGSRMFTYSTCTKQGRAEVFPLTGEKREVRQATLHVRKLFGDRRTVFIMHDSKFDLTATKVTLGCRPPSWNRIHDTLILTKLLRGDMRSYGLKDLLWVLCGYPRTDEELVQRYAGKGEDRDYRRVPKDVLDNYQRNDAKRTMLLFLSHQKALQECPSDTKQLYDWERRLIYTTMQIEQHGIMVSRKSAHKLLRWTELHLQEGISELASIVGTYLNPNGPDVRTYLFGELGMPVLRRTPGQEPSANKDVLLELRLLHPHPALDGILKCRSYIRAKAALESYLDLCDADGILHPRINTCAARTGRESSAEPNVQNFEKAGRLRNPYPVPLRRVIVPRPGYILVCLDYSGIEMRILVHFSRDSIITEVFRKGGNPHTVAAKIWYPNYDSLPPGEKVSRYTAAKNGNFAYHYGAGLKRMAAVLQLPLLEVRQRRNKYNKTFPGAVELPKAIGKQVRENGCVVTALGRRISVPKAKPYIGTNYIVQGTAADVIKIAQVRVDEYIQQTWRDRLHILFPVHDEIVLEVDKSLLPKLPDIVQDIRSLMVDFPTLRVPLEVGCSVSERNWAETKETEL